MNIIIENLEKKYERNVLESLSLDVEGYHSVAIIGKSGCGKSTLLRLLTGIEAADQGEIWVNKEEVIYGESRTYQDKISMVFQQHNLFPHLSLEKNITLILEKRRGMNKQEAKELAKSLLEQLHLKEEMHKRPKFISGGQAQRASIARALATSPEIIFMDEPTAALDPILSKEVLDEVLKLKNTGTEFVFVTHEIAFVKNFADYVIFIDEGKIEEHGPVEIMQNPKTKKLKDFLEFDRE
jgi:polar amino acid transport system ATP-binding protein